MIFNISKIIILLATPFLLSGQNENTFLNSKYFKNLNALEKEIIIHKGTEPPFSGLYNNHFKQGVYICKACKTPLYCSNAKFNSNCGWPAFDDEISGSIKKTPDYSNGMIRTEICCAQCLGHLGHVFYGEKYTETNTRHCVNSISIEFMSDSLLNCNY